MWNCIISDSRRVLPMTDPAIPQYILRFGGYVSGNRGAATAILYRDHVAIRVEYMWVDIAESPIEVEFRALILGMERMLGIGITSIKVESSESTVIDYMEIGGKLSSNIPATSVRRLYRKARALAKQFEEIEYDTITKEANARAIHISRKVVEDFYKHR
jgi:ribonuclease HI